MAVTTTQWKRYNKGYYFSAKQGSTTDLAIDFKNYLAEGDSLNLGPEVTTTSEDLTISQIAVRYDALQGYTEPHQAQFAVTSNTIGAHPVKLKVTTVGGLTIVKHFDIRVER